MNSKTLPTFLLLILSKFVAADMQQIPELSHHISSEPPPNIVLIVLDDVGWADLSYCTTSVPSIPTPKIDALAARGVRFSHHYVSVFALHN